MKKFILVCSATIILICITMYYTYKEKHNDSKLDTIVLSEVTHSIFYSPLYVSIEKGYFKDEGIDIDLVLTLGADKVATSVISGAALSKEKKVTTIDGIIDKISSYKNKASFNSLPPLFENKEEYKAFCSRHEKDKVKREDIANWTVGIHGALSILSYEFPDTAEYYLWQRTAESKSMLCNIYLPFVLLALVLLAKEIDNKCNWLILGMIVTAGMAMSVSGIFIIAAMVGIGVVVIMTVQKKWKYMINTMLCMMPGMMIGMIRILQ